MAGLVFLGTGIAFALIGRILLIGAAFGVSVWWGLGVFLPFGPLLFRLSYPDLAPTSRYFRLAAMPCFLAFFWFQPTSLDQFRRLEFLKSAQSSAAPRSYGTEKRSDMEERRVANNEEFQRLAKWAEALRLKKRDLLHSDVKGNIAYDAELAQYEAALARATAEKQEVFSPSSGGSPNRHGD